MKKALISALALLSATLWTFACRPEAAVPRPNILYIMTDDHAAHMLSSNGSRIASTPNLDRIANEGIRFTNAFCTNSLCSPSRATLLTGKYSHKNGKLTNRGEFDGSQQTFPKLLRKAGYQTAIVGKWHLQSDPTGFDYSNVLPGQGRYMNPVMIENGVKKEHKGYVTDIITDTVLDWLKNRDKTRPFALLYHHKAPHGPWEPDQKHVSMFADEEIAEPVTFNDDLTGRAELLRGIHSFLWPDLRDRFLKWKQPTKTLTKGLSPAEGKKAVYQAYVKDYMRVVASVDDNVGRVLDFLDENGLAKDTIVIYTTDNGMFVGDHGLFDKRLMHEEALRLPLLVRYPRAIKPGTVTGAYALNVDYAETILDYADVKIPADMQGRSLRPVLEGHAPADWRKTFYYHYYEFPSGHNVPRHYGVRTDRYKLMHYYENDVWELIDLEKDPHEYKNVYSDPAHAEVVKELKAEIQRLRKKLEVPEA